MPDLPNNPKPAKLAATTVAPDRFSSWRDHFAAERRWFADTFAREKMIEMLKQLLWVVPLTLLIWVYAEREQVTKEQNETIPFELVSADPDRLVTLKPPQDSNLVVELEGPRARVQSVLQRLRGGAFPQGLRIQVDPALNPNQDHQLPTISLIANHELFRHNGITVTRTQPDTIDVRVDQIVEREARVEPAPGTANVLESTTFEPATVKVRGPLNVLEPASEGGGGNPRPLVVYAHIPETLLASPGSRDAEGLELSLPPPLARDARISIIPSKVDATLQVRAADEVWEMQAMTVTLDQPKTVAEKYTVEYPTSLPGVRLIGPKDVIEEMKKPEGPKPYAQLRVTSEDAGPGEKRRTLRFVDLPDRVRVHDADRQRTIAFRLIPRSDFDQ
ncbi:MAG TPA: hypothetical protein VGR35_10910 [Tepidisphaeraceae bacterium]|nr:hypothetical protein [Tepidisphaeraceae bacterium]